MQPFAPVTRVLSVLGAAVPNTQLQARAPTPDDQHPLCGSFAWWDKDHWHEDQLWEADDCTKFYHNAGRVNMQDTGKCLVCWFYS